jgi:hypothetical protein
MNRSERVNTAFITFGLFEIASLCLTDLHVVESPDSKFRAGTKQISSMVSPVSA